MNSVQRLKLKKPVLRYAGGGSLAAIEKKHAKQKVPSYADGTTTYSTNMPAEGLTAYKDLIAQAGQLTNTTNAPYQPYEGQRQAQFTPLQQQSYSGIAGLGTNNYSQQAAGLAGLAGQQASQLSYNPTSFNTYGAPQNVTTGNFTQAGNANAYMNPYMQSVVDTQKREAVRADDVARGSRNAAAVGAGAFGGSRQAIQEAEADRNLQTRLGDIQSTGSNAAFQQAQAQFNADQSRQLSAAQGNQSAGLTYGNQVLDAQRAAEASKQFGASYGLQGLQTGIQGATAQGNLGQNLFNQQSDIYGLQNTAGAQQQQQIQSGLDQKYADYQQQQNYPYQQLGFMSDILRGTQGTTSSVYQQAPQASNLQNVIGLGTALAGIGKAAGGAIEGGLASIAPASAGDFADGGIVGYAEGDIIMPPDYNDGTTPGTVVGGAYTGGKAFDAAKRAVQSTLEDAGTLSKYGTDAQSVIRSTQPAGMVGKVLSKAGPAASLALTALDSYNTPLRQYEDRFALGHDPDRGIASRAGINALGFASDLGNTLTGGLAGKYLYRDMQGKKVAPEAKPAAPKDDTTKLPPITETPESEAAGLKALFSAGNVSAGPAPTVAGVRAQQQEALGNGLQQYQQDATAASGQLEAAQRAVSEKYQQGLKDIFASQGITGEHRRAGIEKQQAGLPQEQEDMKNNALLRAGLSILAAPPGGGAFASIARGALPALEAYGVDKEKFMARKSALDESMNKLLDAQQAERGLRGKALLDAQQNTDLVEVEAKKRLASITDMVSQRKNITNPEALFKSFSDQYKEWQTHTFEAGKANSANNLRLGIAQYGLRGGAGNKPLVPGTDAYAREMKAYTDLILKNNLGMLPAEAMRQAKQMLESQRPGAAASPMAGWGAMSVE